MQAYEHQALVRGKWRTIITIMVGKINAGVNISHYSRIFQWGRFPSFRGFGEELGHFEAQLNCSLYKCLNQA